jgi:hypothetical protein
MIKWYPVFSIALLGFLVFMPSEVRAATCANGVYNAGCVGQNGAAVVHKPVYGSGAPPPIIIRHPTITHLRELPASTVFTVQAARVKMAQRLFESPTEPRLNTRPSSQKAALI